MTLYLGMTVSSRSWEMREENDPMESKSSVTYTEGVAKIDLSGRLDATNAPALQE